MPNIERRIQRAEESIAACNLPARPPILMASPVGGDDMDVMRHRTEVEQASRDGVFVIELVPLQARLSI